MKNQKIWAFILLLISGCVGEEFEPAPSNQGSKDYFRSGTRIEMHIQQLAGSDGSISAGIPEPYDTLRKEACAPTMMTDDTIRCVPVGMHASVGFFADTNCSKRAALRPKDNCASLESYITESPISCGANKGVRIYERDSKVDVIFVIYSGACTETTYGATHDFYLFGDELPPSSFVEFMDVGHIVLM